jgi:CobQ-like glutamine amidotransferase family enzyme
MTDLVIADLYPGLLRTYGDRDNVVVLARRAEWRGFSVRIEEVGRGEAIPADVNVIVLGGGTDSVQQILGRDVARRADEVRDAVARGAVVLGVCGGYQLLGRRYILPDGSEIQGLGVLDVETRASRDRIVGRVQADARLWGRSFDLVGFENHGGRTTLGTGAEPLASIRRGHGNNGRDRIEGAAQGSVVGTYLHGPVLALNPELTDAMLARALAPLTGGEELDPLDDALERRAHDGLARRVRDDRRPARRHRLVVAAVAAVIILAAVGSSAAVERHEGSGAKGWFESGWMDIAQVGRLASTPVPIT